MVCKMKEKIILLVRKILIVLLVFWMLGVFFLSNQNGEESSTLSTNIALVITFRNEESAENIEPTVRKVAHMMEYAIGAMLFYGILITYEKYSLRGRIIMTIAFIILYAGLDEFHQSFINERNGNLIDIGIDSFGGALGIGASYLMEGMIKVIDNKVQTEVYKNNT